MSNGCDEFYPPCNFSWIVENELAAMGWPQTRANLEYLVNVGIKHLVTLSPEKIPPITGFTSLKWTKIDIEEFEAPTINQIMEFIDVCKKARMKHEPVGVHCRMGIGRTGLMVACYLLHFHGLQPRSAIMQIRHERPWSIETREQERSVFQYYDYLQTIGTQDVDPEDGRQ